ADRAGGLDDLREARRPGADDHLRAVRGPPDQDEPGRRREALAADAARLRLGGRDEGRPRLRRGALRDAAGLGPGAVAPAPRGRGRRRRRRAPGRRRRGQRPRRAPRGGAMIRRAMRAPLAVLSLAAASLALAPPALAAAAKTVTFRGTAYEFNKVEVKLAGAQVRVAEDPRLGATVRADGTYALK